MGKGTAAQLALAERLPNPRIGACRLAHCRTLLPTKAMYHGLCWFHFRMLHHWAKKTGWDLEKRKDLSILDYEDWLHGQAANLRKKRKENAIQDRAVHPRQR